MTILIPCNNRIAPGGAKHRSTSNLVFLDLKNVCSARIDEDVFVVARIASFPDIEIEEFYGLIDIHHLNGDLQHVGQTNEVLRIGNPNSKHIRFLILRIVEIKTLGIVVRADNSVARNFEYLTGFVSNSVGALVCLSGYVFDGKLQ